MTTLHTAFNLLSVEAIHRSEPKVSQAAHLLGLFAEDAGTDMAWGLVRLMETLPMEIKASLGRSDMGTPVTGALGDISCALIAVAEVVRAINEDMDDLTLHAVVSLLDMAKLIVDDAANEGTRLMHEAKGGADGCVDITLQAQGRLQEVAA